MKPANTFSLVRPYATVALVALAVAASAGLLLRFGLYQGMPGWAQNLAAVRHAHSHLMYFGWGTLGIMLLIWHLLPRYTKAPLPRLVPWQMAATAIAALLSFPAFWANGYGVTQVGPLALPLGSIVSGLNGLTWFGFVILYVRATRHQAVRPLALQLWDWALVLLLLASGGALGLVGMVALDHPSFFLQQAFLHLFLDLFAAGWFTLALLGIAWAWIGERATLPRWLPSQSLAICLAPTFVLGISPALLPPPVLWIGLLANCAAGLLLAVHVWALWQRRAHLPVLARFGLLSLAAHALIAIVLIWPGLWQWSTGTMLHIFFLHNLLLGWMSSILLGSILVLGPSEPRGSRWIAALWVSGVTTMLIALLGAGLTHLLPVPPLLWLQAAAWSSVLVVITLVVAFGVHLLSAHAQKNQDKTADPVLHTAVVRDR